MGEEHRTPTVYLRDIIYTYVMRISFDLLSIFYAIFILFFIPLKSKFRSFDKRKFGIVGIVISILFLMRLKSEVGCEQTQLGPLNWKNETTFRTT